MIARRSDLRPLGVLWATLVLTGAFALRVYDLGVADLSFDEVATVFVAHRPIPEVIRYVAGAAREHPPFYYLVMAPWMQVAGTREFTVRLPSALFGLLACALSFTLGRRLLGGRGAWWSLILSSVAPLSVWAGRNGRMYALVMLLSLAVTASWLRWRGRPTWRAWLVFTGFSAIGAMTHYYLVLLWAVQAVLLLALPRRTRRIRILWLKTLGVTGLVLALFVAVSPGVRAMVIEVLRRFPVRTIRLQDLRALVVSLYLGGFAPELAWVASVSLGLTVAGWIVAWRRNRLAGVLLGAWFLVPLVLVHFIPEALEPRYLMPVVPALLLSLAGLLAALRSWPLALIGAVGVALFSVRRLPIYYDDPDTTFSTRMRTLSIAAAAGDALVMNGPWPRLLLSYYPAPDGIAIYAVPEAAPPGFAEAVDVPRLETIVHDHERLWVSYGAIHWADPQYSVSRWLAENTFCVYEQAGMSLCLPRPQEMTTIAQSVDLGPRLSLLRASVDRLSAQAGDALRIELDLQGRDLDREVTLALGLLDGSGTSWAEREARLGPVHQPSGTPLPVTWSELSGLWLLPGIPPGRYTLGMRAYGDGVETGAAASAYGWVPLGSLNVQPGLSAPGLALLLAQQQPALPTTPTGDLSLVGLEPYATHFMEGYLAGFHLWWQVRHPGPAEQLEVRLVGPAEIPVGSFPLGPAFYPASAWQVGDVVRQSVFFQLPDGPRPGSYSAEARLLTRDGSPLPAGGGWFSLFSLTIEARGRDYRAPLSIQRKETAFGDVLSLLGYRLGPKLRPGSAAQLTVYWRAEKRPDRIFAVFNHLRAADGTTVWQEDSWPQAGIYTTNHWLEGEVVAETYTVRLPAALLPGTYQLVTGVYDAATGDRLPATDTEAHRLRNDELILFEVDVRQ